MSDNSKPRYPELDLLRTVAIAMMVLYHLLFDLSVFYGYDIDIATGWWKFFARATATLFLLLVGISASIASASWEKSVRRFLKIGGAAMLVTAATYSIDPDTYVRFGILHLIAVSALLLPLFTTFKNLNIVIGALILFIGNAIADAQTGTSLLVPLGIAPSGFRTVDWFPLLPWFGVILIGSGFGNQFYVRNNKWRTMFSIPRPAKPWRSGVNSPFPARRSPPWADEVGSIFSYPGKHSLLLYLIHQPILLVILHAVLGPWG